MSFSATAELVENKLPEWDLTDLYPSIDDPAIKADIAEMEKGCKQFDKDYREKIQALSGDELAAAIAKFEQLQEIAAKLGSYAGLLFATKMNDPQVAQFYQNTQEQLTDIFSGILFFTLDINKITDEAMVEKLESAALKHYAPWLRDIRALRPYQLADELEKMLMEKQVAGASAWMRLFDETSTGLRFNIDRKKLTESEVFNLLVSRDGEMRKKAGKIIGKVLKENSRTFTLITNTLAKDKDIESKWRGFKRPISSRNVENCIEDEVVDALLKSVRANYADISHRYYALKAKWFDQEQLDYWDRNAPLPFEAEKHWDWDESRELVLTSYRNFSPKLAEVGQLFFDKPWIDVPPKPGKTSGAFAHPVVPSVHPYLLLNFQGKARDVMTLAHELGHGVHQVLAGKQGQLLCDTPLTLAETASVFGEQLTFREMVRRESDAKARKALIAGKVEDMINTVVRQIAFCSFEVALHDARKKGELTTDQINKLWMKVQRESLGKAIKLGGNYKYYWAHIPHFIHTPFYVYAYAFGDCLVNSLYAVYEQAKTPQEKAAFEQKYLAMLEAGGTLRHKELLAPFGLDASDPEFWDKGLSVISGMIDELEN